jgi:N-acetylneuraminic acid mutarotase
VPGTTDIGNHCEDCVTNVSLPFAYQLYDQTFTSANVSSNGVVEFQGAYTNYINTCIPATTPPFTYSILAYWDDQSTYTWYHKGIYTSTSGIAPNRIFNIEFRTCTWTPNECFGQNDLNYEVRLYEGQPRFDIVYGGMDVASTSATVGVQKDGSRYTQYSCNTVGINTGLMLTFTLPPCNSPTGTPVQPRPTQTATGTPPTATPTQCLTGGTPVPWSGGANTLVDVYEPASASDGTFIYSAGGHSTTEGGITAQFSRYYPATDAWSLLEFMPEPAKGAGAAYAPNVNKIFVFGGFNTHFSYSNVTRIYDVATGVWSTGTNMPGPRGDMMTNYYDGKIYVIGGFGEFTSNSNESAQPQVWEYDPVANSWDTSRAYMTSPVGRAGTGIINGKIYIAGGLDHRDAVLNTLYEYDVPSNTWSTKAPMPALNNAPGSAVVAGKLWIFGGKDTPYGQETGSTPGKTQLAAQIPYASLIIYDPMANTWTAGPQMAQARSLLGGAAVGNTVVAWGGYNGSSAINNTELNRTLGNICGPTATPGPPTNTATRTNTALPTTPPTATAVTTSTPTPSPSPISTATPTTSHTPTRTPTIAATASQPTQTLTHTATVITPTPTATAPSNSTAIATATVCTPEFSDVAVGSTFYDFVRCLACKGIVSGYSDGTFKPGNEITRGQITKIVSNAAGYEDEIPSDRQTFEDVPPNHPFWLWIERLVLHRVMGGYPCGADVEPCNPPGNLPYFRPYASATRGQLAKIVSNAAGIGGTPTGLFYTDVPEEHPFYVWIMRLTNLGAMGGYPCGGEGEPCDDQNHPYFRPYNNVTRGQASKIVTNTFYPDCQTPQR